MNNIIEKPSYKEIKRLLAEHLGIGLEDIKDDDSFAEELHMGPADLTDFTQTLENSGIDTSNLDLTQIETVGELLEALESNEIA